MADTEMLYMPDIESNYVREFQARVIKRKKDYIMLDRSAFYPEGGGQPSDTGRVEWEGGSAEVTFVQKKGIVKHIIEGDPQSVPDEGVRRSARKSSMIVAAVNTALPFAPPGIVPARWPTRVSKSSPPFHSAMIANRSTPKPLARVPASGS